MVATTGRQDTFTEINQDPSSLATATPQQLFTQAIYEWQPCNYGVWFFLATTFAVQTGLGVTTAGVSRSLLESTASCDGFRTINVLGYKYAME